MNKLDAIPALMKITFYLGNKAATKKYIHTFILQWQVVIKSMEKGRTRR